MGKSVESVIYNGTVYTKATVQQLLEKDDKYLLRGLLAIYTKQTEEEKVGAITHYENYMGFNAFDAKLLTIFAKQWQEKQRLTSNQLAVVRKRMKKYASQLLCIIAENEQKRLNLKNQII